MNSYHFAGGGKEPRPWLWAEHPSKEQSVESADKPLREVSLAFTQVATDLG